MPRRPSAKHLLKAQAKFQAAITTYVISLGARPSFFYDYELDTPAGPLNLTIYGDWIACRFDDVAAGKSFSQECGRPCNPFSGKWNFHYYDGSLQSLDPDRALVDFGYFVERLLSWNAVAA